MDETLVPARVSSPGAILKLELDARGWTVEMLAERMAEHNPIDASSWAMKLQSIVDGQWLITAHMALDLGAGLGKSAEYWMNLETNYRLYIARKERAVNESVS